MFKTSKIPNFLRIRTQNLLKQNQKKQKKYKYKTEKYKRKDGYPQKKNPWP